jgi:formamidopyrimidine-DNA glycosylase
MPEVQAHAERMTDALGGAVLERVELLNIAALKTVEPALDAAVGRALQGVGRRGKYLVLDFGELSHVVHLMQGGRLRPDPKAARRPRGGLVRWRFDSGRTWLLTEAGTERKAGVWAVGGDPLVQTPLAALGPDADQLDRDELASRCRANSRRLHGLLRDQHQLAGIGRMLANEICYAAALSPFANASRLDDAELDRLHTAIGDVLAAALDHERTLADIGRSTERPSKVHNRGGEPCLDCDDVIRTVAYRAYTVAYCPTRQTGGTILADNTTSRFLK